MTRLSEAGREGRIALLNVSPGGVPKRAIAHADVGEMGLAGDAVANLRVHGGPQRAVCLYAMERILALQREGNPVFPGALGENVTTAGLDWDLVVPGARLVSGDVELVVTKYAVPCDVTSIFTHGDLKCYSQKARPGWSRVYARVATPGRLTAGDAIRIVATT